MLLVACNLRNKYNVTNARCLPVVFNNFSTNVNSTNKINTKTNNHAKKYNNIKGDNNNVRENNNDGVPYRRLAFSSTCYYNNNTNNTIDKKHANDDYTRAFNALCKKNDINADIMTPIEIVEKCLAVNDANSLIYVLTNRLPDGSFDDRISRRIIRLLASKGGSVFISLLDILRGKKLTLSASDANSIITSKVKDKKMSDAFSILTIAEDKGLHINDAAYISIAMDLLDNKVGFDSNAFFYILSEMKNKNIRMPIILKEKMILFCKMFPSLRWQHARKFITDFYKDYDLPITRTESRLVREVLETMIISYKVEEALETWVDLSLFKKDKNHETNYEIFTQLNNVELASLLGRAAIILNEREIISLLLKSKALDLGSEENNANVTESNESFDQYIEDLLSSERMTSSSASSPSATVVIGLGLGWLVSRNRLDVASRIWHDDSIMQGDKRIGALQLILDTFMYWKDEQGVPPSVTIEDLKTVSSFTSDIIRGDTLSDTKLSKELIEGLISLYFLVGEKDGAVAAIMRSLEQSIEVNDASFIKVCQMLNNIEEHDAVIEIYKARMSLEKDSKNRMTNSGIVAAKIYSPLMTAMKSLGLVDDMLTLFETITKNGMTPTFPLYITMMEGLNAVGRSDEAVNFIINQPKPKDLASTFTNKEKSPSNYTAILTSALHSVSISSTVSSDGIIAILQKYCLGRLDTLQIQLILIYMRKSSMSATNIKTVLQYIIKPKMLPTYLTSNILMDMLLLSMVSKDESLIKSIIERINESEHSISVQYIVKHKALGCIKIDSDMLKLIIKIDERNNKIISKTLKISDLKDLNKLL